MKRVIEEPETLGRRLQRFREAAGVSQAQLAQAAGVPLGSVRNWEQDRNVPQLHAAARMAQTLGVTLDDLVAGVADMVPPPTPSGAAASVARKVASSCPT